MSDTIQTAAPPADASHTLQRNKMSVAAIVFFVVAAVAPLGAIIGGSPVVFASVGAGAPAIYLIVGVLFAIFCTGYVAMSRHISNAGGFVAYVAEGFGPRVASAFAALSIIGYLGLVSGFWGFTSALIQWTFTEKYGINIHPAVSLDVLVGLVTFLTYRGIDVSLRTLGVLLVMEITVLVLMNVAIIATGGDSGLSAQGLSLAGVAVPGFGIAFLFATTCFTGFEATVVFSEEARDPKRSIPRAAYTGIAIIAMGAGPQNAQAAAQAIPRASSSNSPAAMPAGLWRLRWSG
jgi:amino acid transporter